MLTTAETFWQISKRHFRPRAVRSQSPAIPEEACSLVLNDIFQLVFIDCVLFSKQGIDLAQKIRKLVGSSLEIVMMSGIVSEESITTSAHLKLAVFFKKAYPTSEIGSHF